MSFWTDAWTYVVFILFIFFFFTSLGVSLNPIIVYCSNQEDMDNWFGLLKEHIEINGGTAIIPDTYSRVKVCSYQRKREKS